MTSPDGQPANGVALMLTRHCRLMLAAAPLCLLPSGCGVWDAWVNRNSSSSCAATVAECPSGPTQRITPGHSTGPEKFDDEFAPFDVDEQSPTRIETLAPPPAPAIEPHVEPPAPRPADKVHREIEPTPAAEGKLIKTLKTPRIFSPDGVRSIYDRFRTPDEEGAVTAPPEKPQGPIAQIRTLPTPTHACQYSPSGDHQLSPVYLGSPESDVPPKWTSHPLDGTGSVEDRNQPVVTQAGPSAFRHPLLADPSGVLYETQAQGNH